jgi:hypothetical protein
MPEADPVEYEHDDHHHVPLWLLSLVGVIVAIAILLPNLASFRRAPNIKED